MTNEIQTVYFLYRRRGGEVIGPSLLTSSPTCVCVYVYPRACDRGSVGCTVYVVEGQMKRHSIPALGVITCAGARFFNDTAFPGP